MCVRTSLLIVSSRIIQVHSVRVPNPGSAGSIVCSDLVFSVWEWLGMELDVCIDLYPNIEIECIRCLEQK